MDCCRVLSIAPFEPANGFQDVLAGFLGELSQILVKRKANGLDQWRFAAREDDHHQPFDEKDAMEQKKQQQTRLKKQRMMMMMMMIARKKSSAFPRRRWLLSRGEDREKHPHQRVD